MHGPQNKPEKPPNVVQLDSSAGRAARTTGRTGTRLGLGRSAQLDQTGAGEVIELPGPIPSARYPDRVGRSGFIDVLRSKGMDLATATELSGILSPPISLYRARASTGSILDSFTTSPDTGLDYLADEFVRGGRLQLPPSATAPSHYGVVFFTLGETFYCLFGDPKRRIIVCAPIRSGSGGFSLDELKSGIQTAQEAILKYAAGAKSVQYIMFCSEAGLDNPTRI